MNLFDEHLFDEEMKLFKFITDKEKKENEASKGNDSTQNNNYQDQSKNSLNIENNFISDLQIDEENENNFDKPKKKLTIDQKNTINQERLPKQSQYQSKSRKKILEQQTLLAPQCIQPSFQENQLSFPDPNMNNSNNINFNTKTLPNSPIYQPQRFPNSNFLNLPISINSLSDTKNVEKYRSCASNPSAPIQTKSVSLTDDVNFNNNSSNQDSTSSLNNISPMKNIYIQPNATPDIENFNNNHLDPNLSNMLFNNNNSVDEDDLFKKALENVNMRFNPVKLGFIPTTFWSDNEMTFNDIVKSFFQRKNNSKCRFPHKLYNALIFTQNDPSLFPLIGVYWLDHSSILIRRKTFARLLGIKSIEGSLFHQQGNFPSHGFAEIDPKIVKMKFPNFDFSVNRLITHTAGVFVYGCTEADIDECKWNSSNK